MPPATGLEQATDHVPPRGGLSMPPATGLERATNHVPPKGGPTMPRR
jgi:hypothetical protein